MTNLSPEIGKIRQKLLSSGWPKFIEQIKITGIHGFNGQTIDLKFPVCAVIGENGTGKSTVLKVLASVYQSDDGKNMFFPSDFFPGTAWDKIKNVLIEYYLKDENNPIKRTIRKPTERWKGLNTRRHNRVFYFDINRIRSIESLIGYSKITKKAVNEISSQVFNSETVSDISEIMSRPYEKIRYATTDVDAKKRISVIKQDSGEVSQFHQGSGESITTEIISTLKNVPDKSLVLIDEVESSLHPRSQRQMIRKLLELARVKTLQIVITTHSPYVLEELPPDSRILLTRTKTGINVIYGASTEFCMSQIDERLHPELTICVEDIKSKEAAIQLLRKYSPDILSRVNIVFVGAANIVQTLSDTNEEFPYKIVGVLDADQNPKRSCLKIPGSVAIEKEIIDSLKVRGVKELSDRLGISAESLSRELEIIVTYHDHHSWCRELSNRLKVSEESLWNSMVFLWVNKFLSENEVQNFGQLIERKLN